MSTRTLIFASIAVSVFLVAVSAEASDTKTAIYQVETAMRDVALKDEFKKPLANDAKTLERAQTELDNVHVAVERSRAALSVVPSKDRNEPAVVALTKRVDEAAAYRDRLRMNVDAATKGAAAAATAARAFLAENARFERTVRDVHDLRASSAPNMPKPEALKRMVAELSELDAICSSKYANLANPADAYRIERRPKDWCEIAAQRSSIFAKALRAELSSEIQKRTTWVREQEHALTTEDGYVNPMTFGGTRCVDGPQACKQLLDTAFKSKFDATSTPYDEQVYADLLAKIGALRTNMEAASSKFSFPRDAQATGKVGSMIAREVRKYVPTAVVRRSGFTQGWVIEAGTAGIPTNRTRKGVVEFKIPQETWCHQVKFIYGEQYAGGGTYTPGSGATFSDERIQKCN